MTTAVSVAVLLALAGTAGAQSVEFRIVERGSANQGAIISPSTVLAAGNPTANYAVQARVSGGHALGGFSFDIVIPGEPDSNGTLTKLRISSSDGTYYTGAATANASVGSGGMARQYTYLAGIGASFNGAINTSTGTFTNTPGQQEIGLITGSASGAALMATPGIDPSGFGSPATWSGYGLGVLPSQGDAATLDPAIGPQYLAQGLFVDIYRFRYTTTNFAGRVLPLTLANATAQTFSQFVFSNGSWGPQAVTTPFGDISVNALQVFVSFPAPGSSVLLALGGLLAARRRRPT